MYSKLFQCIAQALFLLALISICKSHFEVSGFLFAIFLSFYMVRNYVNYHDFDDKKIETVLMVNGFALAMIGGLFSFVNFKGIFNQHEAAILSAFLLLPVFSVIMLLQVYLARKRSIFMIKLSLFLLYSFVYLLVVALLFVIVSNLNFS